MSRRETPLHRALDSLNRAAGFPGGSSAGFDEEAFYALKRLVVQTLHETPVGKVSVDQALLKKVCKQAKEDSEALDDWAHPSYSPPPRVLKDREDIDRLLKQAEGGQ